MFLIVLKENSENVRWGAEDWNENHIICKKKNSGRYISLICPRKYGTDVLLRICFYWHALTFSPYNETILSHTVVHFLYILLIIRNYESNIIKFHPLSVFLPYYTNSIPSILRVLVCITISTSWYSISRPHLPVLVTNYYIYRFFFFQMPFYNFIFSFRRHCILLSISKITFKIKTFDDSYKLIFAIKVIFSFHIISSIRWHAPYRSQTKSVRSFYNFFHTKNTIKTNFWNRIYSREWRARLNT